MCALVLPVAYVTWYHTFVTGPNFHKRIILLSTWFLMTVFFMFVVLFPLSQTEVPTKFKIICC
jgi:multisubunit Na+/H+ antiporter MnhF subunit